MNSITEGTGKNRTARKKINTAEKPHLWLRGMA